MSSAHNIATSLGGGKEQKNGKSWLTLCPCHEDSNPSLSVKDEEGGEIIVNCHAGCNWKDVKDKLQAMGLFPEKDQGRRGCGQGNGKVRKNMAAYIWEKSVRDHEKIKQYLATRKIKLDDVPASLRFNKYQGTTMMVSAVTMPEEDKPVAIHRTFLDDDYKKTSRKMLGTCSGRAVWLSDSAKKILVGEGIETTLSAMVATGMPGVACLSTAGMENVVIPDHVKEILILVDSDPNHAGQKAASKLASRFHGKVWLITPDDSCFTENPKKLDFNDLTPEQIQDRFKHKVSFDPRQEDGWEHPISIKMPKLPEVTREMMPEVLADMVFANSANTETPIELSLMMGLATIAAACQKKYAIATAPDHTEQLSLWTLAVLESGNRKSSVEKTMVGPLRKWEIEKREELRPIIEEATLKRKNEETLIKGLRSKLSKCKPEAEGRQALQREIVEMEMNITEVPKAPQAWEQDITPEHLGTVMNDNNECMGLFSSEGGIFDIIAGRYSKGVPNLDIFLQSHSGDPVRVSRGSRQPVNLQEPALSIGISPQPAVIKEMSSKPGFRGRGLIARFLYAIPVSPLGHRSLETRSMDSQIHVRYSNAIQRLLNAPWSEENPVILPISREAKKRWKGFALQVEADMRDGERFEHIRDWAGKLPGQVARIAGVFHCIEHDDFYVSQKTMNSAIKLGEILIQHALAAFDLMGADEGMTGARKIFEWIQRNNKRTFSQRNCFEANKGTFKKVAIMKGSLDVLIEHFIIRELPQEKKRGKPSRIFEVNPDVILKEQKPIRNIRNSKVKSGYREYCEPFSVKEKKQKMDFEQLRPKPVCKTRNPDAELF